MRLFIHRAVLFVLPMMAWFLFMAQVNLQRLREDPGVTPVHVLATGDSHIGCGLDTNAYQGLRNSALPAEPLLLSWWKIRRLAEYGRMDTILLGFGPHNLSDLDHRRFREHGWATERLVKRMYPLVPMKEAMRSPVHQRTYWTTLFMQLCTWPRHDHHEYIGAHSGLRRTFVANADSALDRHFLDESGGLAPVSSTALSALDSIISLCEQERIALYLLSTPVHKSYRSGIPASFNSFHDSLADALRSRGVHVLLYADLFSGDSLFADSDHLNARGAELFTRKLKADIIGR